MTLYYLRNVHAGFLGNAPVFWSKCVHGDSPYLERAERFTYEDAKKIIDHSYPNKWQMIPCDFVNEYSQKVFDYQDIHKLDTWIKLNKTEV